MKIAAIYTRVSSDKQKEEMTIASQVDALTEFADREGFEVPDEWVFQDNGFSGANLIRPGLERIRDLAAEGQIQAVLAYSPDRLSRKYAYQVLLIEELARQGVETAFIKTPQTETPEGQLLLQFQGMIAEYERAQILERTRRGRIYKAKQGQISALGGAPYGYRYVKKNDEVLACYEIIESEAEVVRMIFEWYTVAGLKISAIRDRLNERGYLTPKNKTHWRRSTIWKVLNNPAYKGKACFGKTCLVPSKKITRITRLRGGVRTSDRRQSRLPQEKWIEIPVPAIISEDTFSIAQNFLMENKKLSPRKTIEPSLLQGIVHCQKCSYALSRASNRSRKSQHYYYFCGGSVASQHPNRKAVCDQKNIRCEILDNIVWSEVLKLLEDPTLIQLELDRRLKTAQNFTPTTRRQETLSLELTRIQKSMERIVTAYQDDLLSLDELRTRLPILRQKEKTINAELASVEAQKADNASYLQLAETLSSFLGRMRAKAETLDIVERQKIVRLLVREVVVGNDNIVIRHFISGNQLSREHQHIPPHFPEEKNLNRNYLLCPRLEACVTRAQAVL